MDPTVLIGIRKTVPGMLGEDKVHDFLMALQLDRLGVLLVCDYDHIAALLLAGPATALNQGG